jgi:hypothetical protein
MNIIQSRLFSILFCASLPLCTFLLVPTIEGTIFPYLMGLGTLLFALFGWAGLRTDVWNSYLKSLACFTGFWIFFFGASQLGNYMGTLQSFEYLNLIKPEISGILFRKTLFTQSLYFLACVSIFLYYKYIFPKEHLKYLKICCWVFLTYGFYEWTFYLLFGQSGDFIANRKMEEAIEGSWSGSWLQTYNLMGLTIMRFKSTFGEPSFFSLTCVPFFFVYLILENQLLAGLLFLALVLTISTSAYLGVLAGLVALLILRPSLDQRSLVILGVLLTAFIVALSIYWVDSELWNSIFGAKFSGEIESGAKRIEQKYYYDRAYEALTPWQKTFGVGQGYSYNSVLIANLVNFGYLGSLFFFFLFLMPFIKNFRTMNAWHFAAMIICFLYIVNVAELYQPTTWAIVGLAWRNDLQTKQ